MTARNEPWWGLAACRGADPTLFEQAETSRVAQRQIAQAKEVCRRCPVLAQCRSWALGNEEFGVWGGMSEDERRAEAGAAQQPLPAHRAMPLPDWVVVERLMADGVHPGATREEVALAAVGLVQRHWSVWKVSAHLSLGFETVRLWVERATAGESLVQDGEWESGVRAA